MRGKYIVFNDVTSNFFFAAYLILKRFFDFSLRMEAEHRLIFQTILLVRQQHIRRIFLKFQPIVESIFPMMKSPNVISCTGRLKTNTNHHIISN